MPTGCEFYSPNGSVLFNHNQPPFVYYGATALPANSGSIINADSYNRDNRAPNITDVEGCIINAPAGATIAAVTGSKNPTSISIYVNSSTGATQAYYIGTRSGSGTMYFFGPHPGTSTLRSGLEFYNTSGKVIFDTNSRAMRLVGTTYNYNSITMPSGRQYAVINQQYEVALGNTFVGPGSQGNRQYVRFYTGAGYTSGTFAGLTRVNTDITLYAAGDPDDLRVVRNGFAMFVDVTGY